VAGGSQDSSDDAITGINVTPLVDITLVLLIIFMVTARQIVSKSVPLDLPPAATGSEVQTVFSIVLAADGSTMIDSKQVAGDDVILGMAKSAQEKNNELRAIIKADTTVQHGRVIHVLDLLKQAQVKKIAFGVSPAAPGVPAPGTVPVVPPGGPGGGGQPAPAPR